MNTNWKKNKKNGQHQIATFAHNLIKFEHANTYFTVRCLNTHVFFILISHCRCDSASVFVNMSVHVHGLSLKRICKDSWRFYKDHPHTHIDRERERETNRDTLVLPPQSVDEQRYAHHLFSEERSGFFLKMAFSVIIILWHLGLHRTICRKTNSPTNSHDKKK